MKIFKIVLISCVWLTAFGQQEEINDENKNLSVVQMSTFENDEKEGEMLVQMMPCWIPGKQNREVAKNCYTIPMRIHIN